MHDNRLRFPPGIRTRRNFDNTGQYRTDETMAQTAQIAIENRVIIVLGVAFTVDIES
jgi:hypothetical protein